MGVPGFTADVVERSQERYRMTAATSSVSRRGVVVPQDWTFCCDRPAAHPQCRVWLRACCDGINAACPPAIDICGCNCCPAEPF